MEKQLGGEVANMLLASGRFVEGPSDVAKFDVMTADVLTYETR